MNGLELLLCLNILGGMVGGITVVLIFYAVDWVVGRWRQ
jgi:hypothetical protein